MSFISFDDFDDDLPCPNHARGYAWGAEKWVPSHLNAEDAFTKMSLALLEAIIAARCGSRPKRPPRARPKINPL